MKITLLALFATSAYAVPAYQDAVNLRDNRIEITQAAHDDIVGASLIRIMYEAASTPVYDFDGNQIGYRLTDIEPDSVYETAGLRNGDIVLEIDGVPLLDPKTAVEILRYVKAEPRFTYKVLRGAVTTEFTVSISNL